TAAMFNYSYYIPTIRALAPYLNFGVAAMPQIGISSKSVNYANYWGMTVSRNSAQPDQSWQFVNWLASNKENAQMYLELTKKPAARRDLVLWQASDPDLGIFAEQALTAHSWYQVNNLSIEKILADMIESVVIGKATIKEAINKASNQITLLAR
ncbi:extracellular solute-binding protein, partial [Patescibacteria group bacterium]|nr:extracellular solute-binding protein [Patescibacteria group bacterium]